MNEEYYCTVKQKPSGEEKWQLISIADRPSYSPAIDALLYVLEQSQTHMSLSQWDREKILIKLFSDLIESGNIRIYDGIGKCMYEIAFVHAEDEEE